MGAGPRRWLVQMAKESQRIVEVGVWKGMSTKLLASNTSGKVWAVDHWLGTPDDAEQHAIYGDAANAKAEFEKNLAAEIAAGKVTPLHMGSVDAAAYLIAAYGKHMFDFVFIDADHSYEACLADIRAFAQLVPEGGTIAGHDYKAKYPGVIQAVQECYGWSRALTFGPGSIWSIVL